MRKIVLFAALLVLYTMIVGFAQDAGSGAPGVGDSLYPGFGNGGYDVQHYTLDLTVDPAANHLAGVTRIDAVAAQDLSSFNLDLIGFDIEAIWVNDTAATFARERQELTISPAQALKAGEAFTVEVRYSGTPRPYTSPAYSAPAGWQRYGRRDGCPCSYVASSPDGAATFYPVNDHPLDKATYTLRVTVSKPYEVAQNGILTDIIDNGDTITTISEVTSPMASYLTTINIADFDLVTDAGTHGVPIRNYFQVGIRPESRAVFAPQDEMIGFFESVFGEYPFDVYGVVVVNDALGSALETQTLSLFGVDFTSPNFPQHELVVAHELAHQWFGDSLSVGDWRDIWLNEGFATYAEGLWIEHTQGAAALDAWARDLYDQTGQHRITRPPGDPLFNDLFNWNVYNRGALTLHALRLKVGDEVFFSILQTWYERHRDGNVRTADFVALASERSGDDLTGFFDAWLYAEAVPPLPEMSLG
jgi:aminopeptidase N